MDVYMDLCHSLGLPVWLASLLHAATRLRNDHARRKKVFRLLQRKLFFNKVGVKEGDQCQPTYVYPKEVKMLIRSAFPEDICDYPDPCHDKIECTFCGKWYHTVCVDFPCAEGDYKCSGC